jgi:predicted Fe-Mo cluster-binding NifX family protein
MYLAMESAVDKKTAADMMAKFTREQQANIALLRKLGPDAYSLKGMAD